MQRSGALVEKDKTMPYGDYDGPKKPNKGLEGGACNVTTCQAEPASHYNHGSYAWYCAACAVWIGDDVVNKRDWDLRWRPECGHAMFETREEMDARKDREAKAAEERRVEERTRGMSITLISVDEFDPMFSKRARSLYPMQLMDTRPAWVKANQAPKRARR